MRPMRGACWMRRVPEPVRGLARRVRVWLAVAALCASASAGADVFEVQIVAPDAPELARQLAAELAYAGFVAVAVTSDRDPSERAALRVRSSARVELSVQRAADGSRLQRTLLRDAGEGDAFALRVVEQLRAHLVDVGWSLPEPPRREHAAAPEVTPAPPLPAPAQPAAPPAGADTPARSDDAEARTRPPRLWLEAGVTASGALGGASVPQLELGAALELEAVRASVFTWLPPLASDVEADAGVAHLRWFALGGAVQWALPLSSLWVADAGRGAALFVLDARGEASGGFEGRHERLYTGAYFAELGLGFELLEWLRLRLTARGGVTAPRAVVAVDDRPAAHLGPLFGALGAGIDLTWPASVEEARP